ncbi:MAG: hypothetical protein LBI19_09685 [Oscillospiraceae bacterium]|nr:hypothetical protein [Oscillospiraceae bacterium]
MTNKAEIRARLAFWRSALEKLQKAYIALLNGGAKSYTINDRQLTKLDLPDLLKQIKEAEKMVDELTALLKGQGRRRAVGVIPRDW